MSISHWLHVAVLLPGPPLLHLRFSRGNRASHSATHTVRADRWRQRGIHFHCLHGSLQSHLKGEEIGKIKKRFILQNWHCFCSRAKVELQRKKCPNVLSNWITFNTISVSLSVIHTLLHCPLLLHKLLHNAYDRTLNHLPSLSWHLPPPCSLWLSRTPSPPPPRNRSPSHTETCAGQMVVHKSFKWRRTLTRWKWN